MRSIASFKSHPIHPILVSFPIAFFTGTLVFDIISILMENQGFWQTAGYLEIAGVGSALLAAIPGIIDYVGTVPPNSSAKKRGAKHGILNVTHTTIFFIAWLLRDEQPATIIITMEVVGMIILGIAGFMGGTLVYRNQIGVDPRYANAGKWKELHLKKGKGLQAVATINDLELNQMMLVHAGDKRIVIGKTEGGFVAFDDHCTHKGGSLAGGALICGTVQCPWHGSQFDVNMGEVKAGPANKKIKTFSLTEKEGTLYLQL